MRGRSTKHRKLQRSGPRSMPCCVHVAYLDLRKDTNKCPLPRFLPLGRISCEGAGNGHFLIIVVNFGFRAFWADLTLLCVKMCRFFWAEIPGKKAEIPGKRAEIPGKRAEIPGQIHHDSKMKTWSGMFFLEMVIFILEGVNLQKIVRNHTKICPGKKFVTNEYPGMCCVWQNARNAVNSGQTSTSFNITSKTARTLWISQTAKIRVTKSKRNVDDFFACRETSKASSSTTYRPTPDREAFNHQALGLQIQSARHPQMRPITMSSH